MLKRIVSLFFITFALLPFAPVSAEQTSFKVAWSHYTGWEPWQYAQDSGILAKHAKKHGIKIELKLINDYIESINLFSNGSFDACTMTNMDALAIPCVGGVDSTALIIGDFSNGNDGIVIKNGSSVKDLKGRKVNLVELSVSHYLLARALQENKMSEADVKVINTSDADIGTLFASTPEKNASVVTWNPVLMNVVQVKGANLVYDSSKIPGEIIDMMVVKTKAPASFKKALTGAWFETMAVMKNQNSKKGKEAIAAMAKFASGKEDQKSVDEFKAQLKTTAMFYEAKAATKFSKSDKLKKTMEYVRSFSFDHGLYGDGAPSKDLVGIAFPDGSIMGDKKNVKLRFDASYMQMAADGKL